MSTIWSDAETRELVTLWPTASAAQIAKRLHRPIGAITGKASRLRRYGVLPAGGEKHFAVSQWCARSPARASQVRTSPQVPQVRDLKSAPVFDDELHMRDRESPPLNASHPASAHAEVGPCAGPDTLPLHDALPISSPARRACCAAMACYRQAAKSISQ